MSAYVNLQEFEQAITWAHKAAQMDKRHLNSVHRKTILGNLAKCYTEIGKYQLAIDTYKELELICRSTDRVYTEFLANFASVLLRAGFPKQALLKQLICHNFIKRERTNWSDFIRHYYDRNLAAIYAANKRYDKAYEIESQACKHLHQGYMELNENYNKRVTEKTEIAVLKQEKIMIEDLNEQQMQHLYHETGKIFYPHQIEMIKQGSSLEKTLPIGTGKAWRPVL